MESGMGIPRRVSGTAGTTLSDVLKFQGYRNPMSFSTVGPPSASGSWREPSGTDPRESRVLSLPRFGGQVFSSRR